MKISLICPVYNHTEDVTKPFIEQLFRFDARAEFELILVNNGQEKLVFPKKNNMKILKPSKNLGYAGACNIGFKHATGEIICFINNDVILSPGWGMNILKAVFQYKGCLIGPQLVTWNQATNFKNQPTPYINGWCVVGTKALFDDIAEDGKVWDEGFFLYFEDVELSARAVSKGYSLQEVYLGTEHLGSKSSDKTDITTITKKSLQHFTNKMTILSLEKSRKKRIVFYADNPYGFIDEDYFGKGVGGSEASLILCAREFAKKGWQVEIYNPTTKTGTYHGVEYHNLLEFKPLDYSDVFVLFRNPYPYLRFVNSVTKIFWSCDQYTSGYWREEILPFVDKMVCISPYHQSYVEMVYDPDKNLITHIDLGINAPDYENMPEKIPGRLIYCSVPMRGLMNLARLYPQIKEQVPEASLVITSDYRLWGLDDPLNQEFQEEFRNRPDVTFLGKIPREELVKEQMKAEIMAYPCNYEECFCISAMECIAAGAIPVTTGMGALTTTVGESGVLVSNIANQEEYDKKFVSSVVNLLKDQTQSRNLRIKGRDRALNSYSWKKIIDKWIKLIEELQSGEEKMVKCRYCSKTRPNAFLLSKHMAQEHNDSIDLPEVSSPDVRPTTVLLRFKKNVECIVNGRQFKGIEFDVPSDMVAGVLDILRGSYGSDILRV